MMRCRFPVVVVLLVVASCDRPPPPSVVNQRPIMGTLAKLTAFAPDRATAVRAIDAGFERLGDVNALMSDYVADSEIGRLNALAANDSLSVSEETLTCLEKAAEVSRLSGGAFDVTCRPLVQLWKRAAKEKRLPEEEAIALALGRVGWEKLEIDPVQRVVTPRMAGLQVDLGGIAKGYALDLAARAMLDAGATHVLVDVGGDVLAKGGRPGGEPWRMGVRHPFRPGRVVFRTLAIRDGAVATSGNQERYTEIRGKRYSHIVDPRSGWPAEQAPSVTVVAPDGITADAWATVFSVLSVEAGKALIDRERLDELEVMWIWREGEAVRTDQTPGFAAYLD
jgi:thiamine biosynthesis lipoprotein